MLSHSDLDGEPPPLQIRLFGSPMFLATDLEPIELPSRRNVRLVLLYLLLRGQPVGRADVALALWPELEAAAALARLRASLSHLRAFVIEAEARGAASMAWLELGAEELGGRPPSEIWIDLTRFEAAASRIEAGEMADAEGLDEAIELSEEPLLLGYDSDWAQEARRAAEDRRLRLLEARAARRAAEHDHAAALMDLERALALDPLRESAQSLAIWCEWQSGSPGGARQRLLDYEAAHGPLAEAGGEAAADLRAMVEALRAGRDELPAPGILRLADGVRGVAPASESAPDAWRPPIYRRRRIDLRGRPEWLRTALGAGDTTTLIGPAGAGKSRLAAALFDLLDAEGRAVQWLDLSRAVDSASELQRLLALLETADDASESPIVILDNADVAPDACAAALLRARRRSPGARWLVTARGPIGLAAERRLGMPLLVEAEAADLFEDRSGASSVGDAMRVSLAGLGGLPAMIEWEALRARQGQDAAPAKPRPEAEFGMALEGRHANLEDLRASAIDALSPPTLRLLEFILGRDADPEKGFEAIALAKSLRGEWEAEGADVAVLDAFEELVERSLLLPLGERDGAPRFEAPAFLRRAD